MSGILDEHGPGVYTVVLIAELEEISRGEPDTVISEYSIFHEVRAPGGYGRVKQTFHRSSPFVRYRNSLPLPIR